MDTISNLEFHTNFSNFLIFFRIHVIIVFIPLCKLIRGEILLKVCNSSYTFINIKDKTLDVKENLIFSLNCQQICLFSPLEHHFDLKSLSKINKLNVFKEKVFFLCLRNYLLTALHKYCFCLFFL